MMILGAVHRSPGIYFTAEENPGKPQLGETVDEGSANSHILKWGPLPPNEVGRIAQHVKKGEGGKEGMNEVDEIRERIRRRPA